MSGEAMREMTPQEIEARDAQIVERLALLLSSSADARMNYTQALHVAKWMVAAAQRCGWFLYV